MANEMAQNELAPCGCSDPMLVSSDKGTRGNPGLWASSCQMEQQCVDVPRWCDGGGLDSRIQQYSSLGCSVCIVCMLSTGPLLCE